MVRDAIWQRQNANPVMAPVDANAAEEQGKPDIPEAAIYQHSSKHAEIALVLEYAVNAGEQVKSDA